MSKEYVTVSCTKVAETERALCIRDEDGEKHWIPFSQIKSNDGMRFNTVTGKGEVEMTKWIADQRGIEY